MNEIGDLGKKSERDHCTGYKVAVTRLHVLLRIAPINPSPLCVFSRRRDETVISPRSDSNAL